MYIDGEQQQTFILSNYCYNNNYNYYYYYYTQ